MNSRLSESSARKMTPDTFRTGLVAGKNGAVRGMAMHFTFRDEPGIIAFFAIEALPDILAQLNEIAAETQRRQASAGTPGAPEGTKP